MLPANELATYAARSAMRPSAAKRCSRCTAGSSTSSSAASDCAAHRTGSATASTERGSSSRSRGRRPPVTTCRACTGFVSQELAYQLYLGDRSLAECDCAECNGQPPIALDYHALMRHSVRVRSDEIDQWSSVAPRDAADRLESEHAAFSRAVGSLRLPPFLVSQADRSYDHLPRWCRRSASCSRPRAGFLPRALHGTRAPGFLADGVESGSRQQLRRRCDGGKTTAIVG